MTGLTFKGIMAAIGTAITAYVGGWDDAMQFLLAAMIADYVTGVLAAFKEKKVDSDVMFWGGIRKAIVIGVVGLCFMADNLFNNADPIFRTAAIYFYVAREALSVVENTGRLGVKWPAIVRDRLTQLSDDQSPKQ